jgi:hypothetical protein
MKTYEFTVILPEIDDDTADAIYRRCDDSSVGRSNRTTYAAFDREAESLESAIESAIADLRKVGIQPIRIEIEVPAGTS